jgi:hypothetical protein
MSESQKETGRMNNIKPGDIVELLNQETGGEDAYRIDQIEVEAAKRNDGVPGVRLSLYLVRQVAKTD